MYNRLYEFLGFHNLIYDLQFWFKKKLYFRCTEPPSRIIREQQEKGNFGYGILVDFQKPFDTSDHDIFTVVHDSIQSTMKLNHYGIRVTVSNCFSSYFEKGTQFVSINGNSSDLHFIDCGVPQCSILGLLLFHKSFALSSETP